MTKFVYLFNEGNSEMKEILGGKGANLAEMTRIGLPVPFGFTISTFSSMKKFQKYIIPKTSMYFCLKAL